MGWSGRSVGLLRWLRRVAVSVWVGLLRRRLLLVVGLAGIPAIRLLLMMHSSVERKRLSLALPHERVEPEKGKTKAKRVRVLLLLRGVRLLRRGIARGALIGRVIGHHWRWEPRSLESGTSRWVDVKVKNENVRTRPREAEVGGAGVWRRAIRHQNRSEGRDGRQAPDITVARTGRLSRERNQGDRVKFQDKNRDKKQ